MVQLEARPGDVVVSDFGTYQHWSIVTDDFCEKGFPKLISATKRNGTVQEEPWEIVTNGRKTYVADIKYQRPVHEVLKLAREKIGTWRYSLTDSNCEHFAYWATGLEVTSKQVVAGVTGAVAGATLVGMLSEKPNAIKFLGGAIAIAGIAVWATRAAEKQKQQS